MNAPLLSHLLITHPDRPLCSTVVRRFYAGADIGHRGPSPHQSGHAANNTSALLHAAAVSRAIQLEVERGHVCGPFTQPPLASFHVNPLSARLKPDGSARLILDLSQPRGASVNDGIDPAEFSCSYTSVDEAIALVFMNGGRGALLAKADIKHAFRLIPVSPEQWHLLGFQWNKVFYFDTRLSFGSRSSPRIFNDFAACLAWIFRTHSNNPLVRHYLDDFFLVAPSLSVASRTYNTILDQSRDLGVPLAADKCVPPTTRLVLLGVEIDTDSMTISMPAEKCASLLDKLQALANRPKAKRRTLLSVVGILGHASKCIPPGRGFTRRILDAALSVARPGHRVRLTAALQRDVQWWLTFLPQWNGTFPLIPPRPWATCLQVHTDSSGTAGAAVHRDLWISFPWPAGATAAADCSMTWLELVPVVAALFAWGPLWRGRRVQFFCDNMGVIGVWRRGWSHNPLLMDAIRQLLFLSAVNECVMDFEYIPSAHNSVADALSRGNIARARRVQPSLQPTPGAVPEALSSYLASPLTGAHHLTGRKL